MPLTFQSSRSDSLRAFAHLKRQGDGRRVRKVYSTHNGSDWVEQEDLVFVYDGWTLDTTIPPAAGWSRSGPGASPHSASQGWNMVMTLNSSGTPQEKYTWGLDLSGTSHSAGEIGGLLACEDGSDDYWHFYDANGNP